MRKYLWTLVIIVCFSFGVSGVSFASEQTSAANLGQVMSFLKQSGLSDEDIAEVKDSLKNMLDKGVGRDAIEETLGELTKMGVRGEEFQYSVSYLNDLLNEGESPEKAGNIVARAVYQAKSEGLKGRDLAEKIGQVVAERKQERLGFKESME